MIIQKIKIKTKKIKNKNKKQIDFFIFKYYIHKVY